MSLYIFTILFFLLILCFLSNIIEIPKFKNYPITSYFISTVVIISLFISSFAFYHTKGKTLYIAYFILIGILLYKKELKFQKFNHLKFKLHLKYLFWILPIILLQFYTNFDFNSNLPFEPSDDIFIYASYSKHLVEFCQENKYAMYSELYPNYFSGINPYHFYEIWLNGLITFINSSSYTFNLIFTTYPILVWIFLIGIFSIGEFFTKLNFKKKLFLVGFLFVGPLYLTNYEDLFKDGNFMNSAVFTIPGFVKQTLSFSYFGQKHLPVYIFSTVFFILTIHKFYKAASLSLHGLIVSSFGMFPGIYSGILGYHFTTIKKNYKFLLLFFIISFILFFGVIQLFPLGVSTEISEKTFYFKYFLKDLNWKGEMIRVAQKLFFPLTWFTILYTPLILICLFKIKQLLKESFFKKFLWFSTFSYAGATSFTMILDGLNTEQFLTNLLPTYNVMFIVVLIYIIFNYQESSKNIKFINLTIIYLLIFLNSIFIYDYNKNFRFTLNEKYDINTQNKLISMLKKTNPKYIGYLLSENTTNKFHPMHQCIYYPAKFLFANNFLNYVNLNYPYIEYPKNSSSHAYAPYNQMRYFLHQNKISRTRFEKKQLEFIQKNHIEWIVCEKEVILPLLLSKRVKIKLFDFKSKEYYYKIDLKS